MTPPEEVAGFHFPLSSLENIDAAENRHFWMRVRRHLVIRLLERYRASPSFHVLDIGCGAGGMIASILDRFPSATGTGIDGCNEALERSRRRSKVATFLHQDFREPWSSSLHNAFDVAISMDVIEHLDDPLRVLNEAHRSLKSGGLLIVGVPASMALWSDRDVFLGHRTRYDLSGLKRLCVEAGFSVEHGSYFFSYMALPAYVYRKILAPLLRQNGKKMESIEMRTVPVLNGILECIGRIEVELSLRMPLPFGSSVYCLARKI